MSDLDRSDLGMSVTRDDIMPRMRAYLTRAGYSSLLSAVPADILDIAREIYVEALDAAVPLASVAEYGGDEIARELLPDSLAGCSSYSVMLFSLGRGIDVKIDRYFADGEPLRALLMDSWASESVEALACRVDERLRNVRGDGTMRFAPGYSGFDIRKNSEWLSLIAARTSSTADVEVLRDTGIITPRKSIICMIGWKNKARRVAT
ncbi:MAG: hypothetical protein LBO21_01165 [Synergistaceae bacterium]|nr:hypothetical protein [Synergistaceae bacterium]